MATQTRQPGHRGSESSWLMGASSTMSLIGKHRDRRHRLVHRNTANAATQNMFLDAHLKIIRKSGSSKYRNQHVISCEHIHIVVNSVQLTR